MLCRQLPFCRPPDNAAKLVSIDYGLCGRMQMEVLKVSAKSVPNSVAGAIAGVIRKAGGVEVQAVGAGASNQALKAVAIARGYLAPTGVDLVYIPAFANIIINSEKRTAIKLIVEPR